MNRNYYTWLVLMLFSITTVLAQEKTVTGNVTDDTGVPLLGVNIVVKNSEIGTQTDFDGNFSINVPAGRTLVFSFLGLKTQEVPVIQETASLNVVMAADTEELDAVIITALGIKKEKRALGFAVTTLKAEDLYHRLRSR